jgi:hypothetical protein
LYTAFKTFGDAKGFNFYVQNPVGQIEGMMGDSVKFSNSKSIHAVTPLPGQYRLIHNGKTVKISDIDGYEFNFVEPVEKGAYRVEVHLNFNGKYVPWIYSNPIYVY